jgi:DNA-binding transcriptional regulator YiaG
MTKKYNNIADLVKILNDDMKMTQRDIAEYVNVELYIVSLWKNGKIYAAPDNYDKVYDMVLRLNGRNIKYPGQAVDILREEDGV